MATRGLRTADHDGYDYLFVTTLERLERDPNDDYNYPIIQGLKVR